MSRAAEELCQRLRDAFGERLREVTVERGEVTVEVGRSEAFSVLEALRDHAEFQFDQLSDLAGVDYAAYGQDEWITQEATGTGFSRGVDGFTAGRLGLTGPYGVHEIESNTGRRFCVTYQLLSVALNHRLRVKVFAEEDDFPVLDSVVSIWSVANWFEREAFDLFGIMFEGHPDLRRILTDYGFVGHPFRKDFPLIGNMEVRYDEERERVVYQPVSIEPRVLVPRVIRQDKRYADRFDEEAASDG